MNYDGKGCKWGIVKLGTRHIGNLGTREHRKTGDTKIPHRKTGDTEKNTLENWGRHVGKLGTPRIPIGKLGTDKYYYRRAFFKEINK